MTQGSFRDEVCKAEQEGRMLNKCLGEAEQFLIILKLIVQVEDNPDLPTFFLWWQSRARGGKCYLPI